MQVYEQSVEVHLLSLKTLLQKTLLLGLLSSRDFSYVANQERYTLVCKYYNMHAVFCKVLVHLGGGEIA